MYSATGIIRGYDPATDTATVELVGTGVIDTWFDGVAIDASLNRLLVIYGADCTIHVPDRSRLCEAIIVALSGNPGAVGGSNHSGGGAGTTFITDYISTVITTDGFGNATLVVNFSHTFVYAPTVSYQMVQYALDRSWIDAPTTTSETVHISAAAPSTSYLLTMSATGYI